MAVRLTPKSSSDRILGVVEDGPHGPALKAAVTAAPVDGKANAALIALLARQFGLRPSDLRIVGGASARQKLVEFTGEPTALAQRIEQGLSQCSRQD